MYTIQGFIVGSFFGGLIVHILYETGLAQKVLSRVKDSGSNSTERKDNP
jgi:hypothetical protein